ncbi:hypothetical protein ASD8599_00620 [Ascidiaceihabitans donghaensis]|uniref:HTH tetR-type domain-containing protein n=2 Tax=Ascidiaceihabitans donghaensis TaxID=1510460 RepID=A0A2R8BA18_9RHOB|nr:hypothetical protein ASD8599_00620 [Ascidiaceihabitans donghaensis]
MSHMRHMCLMKALKLTTEQAIIEAGFAVFSANAGASMADVAKHAGVGRATLHRHHPSRDALLNTLAKTALTELDAVVVQATENATSYMQGLEWALGAILPLANRQLFLATAIFEADAALQEAYAAEDASLLNDIDKAKAEGGFDPNLPTAWIAEAYTHLIYAAWKLVQDGAATPNQAAAFAWRTLLKGNGP